MSMQRKRNSIAAETEDQPLLRTEWQDDVKNDTLWRENTSGAVRWLQKWILNPTRLGRFFRVSHIIRSIATAIAVIFALVGSYLYYQSARAVSVSLMYNRSHAAVEFRIDQALLGPVYLHLTHTGVWQNTKDVLRSQPPWLYRGGSCKGFETAAQFCTTRSTFTLPSFDGSSPGPTFCELPPATRVFPCGLYVLGINYDDVRLWQLEQNAFYLNRLYTPQKLEKGGSSVLSQRCQVNYYTRKGEPTTMSSQRNDVIQSYNFPEEGSERAQEYGSGTGPGTGPDPEVQTSSIFLGLETIKELLGLNQDRLGQELLSLRHRVVSNMDKLPESNRHGQRACSGDWLFSSDDQQRQFPEIPCMSKLEGSWTSEKLKQLAQDLQRGDFAQSDLLLLKEVLRLLNQDRDLIAPPHWRITTRPVANVLSYHIGGSKPETFSKRDTGEKTENSSVEVEESLSAFGAKEVQINAGPAALLAPYQLMEAFPKETAWISLMHAKEQAETSKLLAWLRPDDVRWFQWRRPASTSHGETLVGRIDQDLHPGTYLFTFNRNDAAPVMKGIRLSSTSRLGTPQYGAVILCFFTAFLYISFWTI